MKHFFLVSAFAAVIFCISSAFITTDVLYSVHLNELKHQLSELKTSNENMTSKLMKLLGDLSQGNNTDIKLLSTALKGHHPLYPASSCASTPSILNSGYYWIQSWNGSVVKVYCDMTRRCGNITGGWMRVALLDMRDNSAQCPPGLCLNTTLPRTCRKCDYNVTCSSDGFPVYINYTKVCGKIIGYQIGSFDAFSTEFGVSEYLARQSKKLVKERGILSLPGPLRGPSLPSQTVDTVCAFYESDDISHVMPGKKDLSQ